MSLTDAVADKRDQVIDDCVVLVDEEVKKKTGLGGLVIKTGYKAVKGIKPGFIRKVVSSLFDEWAVKLDPFWNEALAAGGSPRSHFESRREIVAEALLSVTDAKLQDAKSAIVRSTYGKLRPSAKQHVAEAVPGLASILEKHAL
jgi:hypothetical protein